MSLKVAIGQQLRKIEFRSAGEVGRLHQLQRAVCFLEDALDVLFEHARKIAAVLDRAGFQPVALNGQMVGKQLTPR